MSSLSQKLETITGAVEALRQAQEQIALVKGEASGPEAELRAPMRRSVAARHELAAENAMLRGECERLGKLANDGRDFGRREALLKAHQWLLEKRGQREADAFKDAARAGELGSESEEASRLMC